MKYKLASTDEFISLCTDALMNNRNRQVDIPELCKIIDPEGTHVGQIVMPHEHANGVLVDLHWRTRWQVKRRGSMEPVECWLDVSIKKWDKLVREHDTEVSK